MLWYNDKKIDAAFRRLRDKRKAVGETSHRQSPEQEAKDLKNRMALAAAAQDISTMISLITQASSLPVEDYIETILGGTRFMYYSYLHTFQTRPIDLTDLVDGLLFMDAKQYIEKEANKKLSQQYRNKGK